MQKRSINQLRDPRLARYRKFTLEIFCFAEVKSDAVFEAIMAASSAEGCIGASAIDDPKSIQLGDLPDIERLLPYVTREVNNEC